MHNPNNLDGRRILVVEDDYFLASDAARVLSGAGAAVLGPFPNERDASAELAQSHPDAAVLDINLGAGASFALAGELKAQRIPFVFLTGYDQDIIPPEFADVNHLIKPGAHASLVEAVSKLLQAAEVG